VAWVRVITEIDKFASPLYEAKMLTGFVAQNL
jgi:hypothetical protein